MAGGAACSTQHSVPKCPRVPSVFGVSSLRCKGRVALVVCEKNVRMVNLAEGLLRSWSRGYLRMTCRFSNVAAGGAKLSADHSRKGRKKNKKGKNPALLVIQLNSLLWTVRVEE